MFSRMKMGEYIEFYSIFQLKPVTENVVIGSLGIHFNGYEGFIC